MFQSSVGCRIWGNHPIDCQIFPIDIELIDQRYWWTEHAICRHDRTPSDRAAVWKDRLDEAATAIKTTWTADELHR